MLEQTGVQRRRGSFYLRIRVPLDVVPLIEKAEIVGSLGTRDHAAAVSAVKVISLTVAPVIHVSRNSARCSGSHTVMARFAREFRGRRGKRTGTTRPERGGC